GRGEDSKSLFTEDDGRRDKSCQLEAGPSDDGIHIRLGGGKTAERHSQSPAE
ncbi:MAG: hypothetical protein Q9205_007146, partial [Flavoplaca limonia]